MIEGRTAKAVSMWIDAQPETWRDVTKWGTPDMSGPYRKVFNDSLPAAVQVADPFHVITRANSKVDECRRRVQNDTLGHRGRKTEEDMPEEVGSTPKLGSTPYPNWVYICRL